MSDRGEAEVFLGIEFTRSEVSVTYRFYIDRKNTSGSALPEAFIFAKKSVNGM